MGDSSRFWGAVFCLVILVVAAFFLWGIFLQSYWALAIPVAVGFLGLLGMGLALLGLPMAPLSILWFHHTLPVTLPVGLGLLVVAVGVSWRYGKGGL